jgi:hypothetical protein
MFEGLKRADSNQAIYNYLAHTSISLQNIIHLTTVILIVGTILFYTFITMATLNRQSLTTYTLLRIISGFVIVATGWCLIDYLDDCQISPKGFDAEKVAIIYDIVYLNAHLTIAVYTVCDVVKDAIDAIFNHETTRQDQQTDAKTIAISKGDPKLEQMLNRCIGRTSVLPVSFGGPNNRHFPALIDTGATTNAISATICDEFSLSYAAISVPSTAMNGTSVNVVGIMETEMYVGGCCDRALFLVIHQADLSDEVVLGMQFINQTRMDLTHGLDETVRASFNFGGSKIVATVGSSRPLVESRRS